MTSMATGTTSSDRGTVVDRSRYSDVCPKAPDSLIRIDELEDALGEKDASNHEPHDEGGPGSREWWVEQEVTESLELVHARVNEGPGRWFRRDSSLSPRQFAGEHLQVLWVRVGYERIAQIALPPEER